MLVNGLRPIATLLESQAVLVAAPPERRRRWPGWRPCSRRWSPGRGRRYLMMNAPGDSVEAISELIPGLRAPSVIPLAHNGDVAIHSVVLADDLWHVLPRLESRRRHRDPGAAGGAGDRLMRRIDLASLTEAERRRLVTRSAVPSARSSGRGGRHRRGGAHRRGCRPGRGGRAPGWRIRAAGWPPPTSTPPLPPFRPDLREPIGAAAANVREVHRAQLPRSQRVEPVAGVVVERRWSPAATGRVLRAGRPGPAPVDAGDDGGARPGGRGGLDRGGRPGPRRRHRRPGHAGSRGAPRGGRGAGPWEAPRRSRRSPTGPRPSTRSTRSSGPATPGSPPPSWRCRARCRSTCRPGPARHW